jgi:hypothetical protein
MKYILLMAGLGLGLTVSAQNSATYGTLSTQLGKVNFIAAALQHDRYFLPKRKLVIGAGMRMTSAFGKQVDFITAPAILTSNKTGPAVLFAPQVNSQIDSIRIFAVRNTAFNFMGNIAYRLGTHITLGFNIDFVGFTLGGIKPAVQTDTDANSFSVITEPTKLNAMLISDNDWGTLNSELYAGYKIDDRVAVKVGLGFSFVEYTVQNLTQNINGKTKEARFRNKSAGLMIGLSYNLLNK